MSNLGDEVPNFCRLFCFRRKKGRYNSHDMILIMIKHDTKETAELYSLLDFYSEVHPLSILLKYSCSFLFFFFLFFSYCYFILPLGTAYLEGLESVFPRRGMRLEQNDDCQGYLHPGPTWHIPTRYYIYIL